MKPDLPIDTQILWLAAELVEKGHCKRTFRDEDSVCALEAVRQARNMLHADSSVAARERLRAKIGGGSIIAWNDAPHTTAEEVALALRTA